MFKKDDRVTTGVRSFSVYGEVNHIFRSVDPTIPGFALACLLDPTEARVRRESGGLDPEIIGAIQSYFEEFNGFIHYYRFGFEVCCQSRLEEGEGRVTITP